MNRFGKLAVGALAMFGAATATTIATTAPAEARVVIGVGIPGPAIYAPYRAYPRCGYYYGPCYRGYYGPRYRWGGYGGRGRYAYRGYRGYHGYRGYRGYHGRAAFHGRHR